MKILNIANAIGVNFEKTTFIYDQHHSLSIDIFYNTGTNVKNVCIYFLHGGRWTDGCKNDFSFVAYKLLRAGHHVAIADYRKHPHVKFPAFVEDAAQGLVAMHNHFEEIYKTTMPIYVMGHSSGAHLGAMLCTDSQHLEKAKASEALIKGFIGIAGPYKFIDYIDRNEDLAIMFGPLERYHDSQPILLAENVKNPPPMLLIHGEKDRDVSPLNTTTLAKIISKRGRAETLILPRINHINSIAAFALPFWPRQTKMMMMAIERFCERPDTTMQQQ